MLRDWTDSDAVNQLDDGAEVLFVRLIMKADDFGRFTADPKRIRALCFPFKDGIRESDISRRLAECHEAGLIALYQVADKPLLEIVNFGQRMRDGQKAKFPGPNDGVRIPPRVAAERGGTRPEEKGMELELELNGKEGKGIRPRGENSGTAEGDALTYGHVMDQLETKLFDRCWKKTHRGKVAFALGKAIDKIAEQKRLTQEQAGMWLEAAFDDFLASPLCRLSPVESLPNLARWLDDERFADDRMLWLKPLGDKAKPALKVAPIVDEPDRLQEAMARQNRRKSE